MANGDAGSTIAVVLLILLLLGVIALVVVAILALPALQASIDNVIVFVNTGIVQIEGLAVSLFEEVSFLLNGAFAFTTNVANDIAAVIATGISTAIDAVVSLGTLIFNTLVSVFNDVKAVVLTIVDAIVNFFNTTIAPILSIVIDIFNAVRLLTSRVVCFISKLICCTLGAGCVPPAVLDCCACDGSCPSGTCDGGFCVPPP